MSTRRRFLSTAFAFLSTSHAVSAKDVLVDISEMSPGDFTWHPERSPYGAVAVIASVPEQRVHVYRNGVRIGVSTCSTGREGHETPTGVFTILQKDKDHRSSTYNDAPMPNMNRLTWDGIALHAGNLPGYPASHGCVRLPLEFSELLFSVTHIGTPVIVAGAKTDPWSLTHPGLVLDAMEEDVLSSAVANLDERAHPSDWTNAQPYPITTVLATVADKRITVMEDGRETIAGSLTVLGQGTLGEHVLVLKQAKNNHLEWVGLTHHSDPDQPLVPESSVVNRLRIPDNIHDYLAQRLHPGMTFVVSDLAATPDRRSDQGFAIMAVDPAQSLRPPRRPIIQ